MYAAMNSTADLFRKTSVENLCSWRRGNTLLGVEAKIIHASKKPTNGPRQVRRKEIRYPPQGKAAPLIPRDRA
jgi:hypothetical protein